MVKPYLDKVGGKIDDDTTFFTGGLNTYQDKAFIENDEMPYVMNMTMYKPPMLCTRQPRETLYQYLDYPFLGDIKEIFAYNDEYIVGVITEHDSLMNNGYDSVLSIRKNNAGRYQTATHSTNVQWDRYYLCYARTQVEEYVYICSTEGKMKLTLDPTRGAAGQEILSPLIVDNHYGIPCWHKGRMFFADPSTNTITFSALNDFDNFDEFPDMSNATLLGSDIALADGSSSASLSTGAYNTGTHVVTLNGETIISNNTKFYYDLDKNLITIETGDRLLFDNNVWNLQYPDYSVYAGQFFVTNARGRITALKSFNDKMYIFCEHSIHILYGDTPLTTSANQFQLVDLNNNLGALDDRYVTVGGGNLYWFGDDCQIYEHTGSYTHMISRPYSTRNGDSHGGIDNIIDKPYKDANRISKLTATSDKLYVNLSISPNATVNEYLFVYDILRRVWWCEDGKFTTICNYSHDNNNILMCKQNGDILKYTNMYTGYDTIWNFTTSSADEVPIEYEFHTRVYGAEGADSRKTLSEIWLQAVSNADVYITDIWTSRDIWTNSSDLEENYKKIGSLARADRTPSLEKYNSSLYEQQRCIVERMYSQRTNTFQIILKGSGASQFYLMKRIWRVV